ncbi:hypothetical protein Tco_0115345 [Tanacetum coccineum]
MTSLGKRYERLNKIPEELRIYSTLPAPVPEQVPSQAQEEKGSIRIWDLLHDMFGDQAFQRWNDIHTVRIDPRVSYLVMASMIKISENARFNLKLKKLIVEHPDQEKLQSKKVKLEAIGYMLD